MLSMKNSFAYIAFGLAVVCFGELGLYGARFIAFASQQGVTDLQELLPAVGYGVWLNIACRAAAIVLLVALAISMLKPDNGGRFGR